MKKALLIFLSFVLLFPLSAVAKEKKTAKKKRLGVAAIRGWSLWDWSKSKKPKKSRRRKSIGVAAVRGLDGKPLDDPREVRDLKGVKKMESLIVPSREVEAFVKEGKLKWDESQESEAEENGSKPVQEGK